MAISHTPCPTVLLHDSPVEDDEFSGGAHERLADALADMILTEKEGAAIALEGEWGSGKSSVVRMLKRLLAKHPRVRVITFDAWAHQGDPLKRIFLETLIAGFGNWLRTKHWAKKRAEFSKRRRQVESTTTPRLTPLGAWAGLFLLLVPLGVVFVSAADNVSLWPPGRFSIGIFLALLPFSVILLHSLWKFLSQDAGPRFDFLDSMAVLSSARSETITSLSFETVDPTSVEFQRLFEELMSEALEKDDRLAVVVLDNLDRIATDDAINIWSTLQIFIPPEQTTEDWRKKLWLVVPYDPGGIRQVWADRTRGSDNPQEEDHRKEVAAAFLSKTFQATLAVPPLVLSDWEAYLSKLLKTALPRHTEEDFAAVYQVLVGVRNHSTPTPRSLKLLVNEIGAIHRQWNDEMPLAHICYYSVCRQQGNVAKAIVGGEIPEERMIALLGQGVVDDLARLHFNVPRSLAQQLLLDAPIRAALQEGDGEVLRRLANQCPEGFWHVLGIVFGETLASEPKSERLVVTALTLAESGLIKTA